MKTWRFLSVLLLAMALSAALAHLMELPGKMGYDANLYVLLHRTLYTNFGRFAGWAEILALVSVLGLAWRVRDRGLAFPLTAGAAGCQLVAMILFFAVVQPVNTTMAGWPLDAIPPDWARWRDRWEYGHAARAVLELAALAALVLSVVRETPAEPVAGAAPAAPARPPVAAVVPAGPRAVVSLPRDASNAVVCETPRDGLRVVFIGQEEEAAKERGGPT